MAGKWIQDSAERMKKKGTVGSFTRIAEKHGKSPKEMAEAVTSNPDEYSEKTRKKAQWLKNVAAG